MTESKTHAGRCFCGTAEIAVSGEPVGMGYCHCQSCRSWSAGPVNAFTLWPPEAMRVTKGIDNVGGYPKSNNSVRKWCKICVGHLMTGDLRGKRPDQPETALCRRALGTPRWDEKQGQSYPDDCSSWFRS